MASSTSQDLLKLERKSSGVSPIQSTLLVCGDKESRPQSGTVLPTKKPEITSVPKSQVLGRLKDFLGVMAEANKRLELEAKDNSEAYDIEHLTGNESEVIEMDLMLGVADLHTPDAVAAAEAAVSGNQRVINLAGESSETGSEDSCDDDSDGSESDDDDDKIDDSSKKAARSSKRPKIVELS